MSDFKFYLNRDDHQICAIYMAAEWCSSMAFLYDMDSQSIVRKWRENNVTDAQSLVCENRWILIPNTVANQFCVFREQLNLELEQL